MADLKIVFMGTPDFAVASLRALVEAGTDIVGVVTSPDKPAGRGLKVTESAVKQYAVEQGLTVLQPRNLKAESFLNELKSLKADLFIIVAFRMLPELVWAMPNKGTFNLHASLLPKYRGAAPINWAVMNGEDKTGITTFFLKHEIDTGDLLLQKEVNIGPNQTAGELHDVLMQEGAELVVQSVRLIQENAAVPKAQKYTGSEPHAPKLFRETCLLNWSWTAKKLHNYIRGLSPYPGAISFLGDKQLKIFRSALIETGSGKPSGTLIIEGTELQVACEDGMLSIQELQLQGKRRMSAEEFLRGQRDLDGKRLSSKPE